MNPCTSRLAPSFLSATGVLEMTYRCNHRCGFCSCPWFAPGGGYATRDEMSAAEWCATIDRLTRMGVCNLAFTGGEALLKEGLFDIIRHAASCTVEHIETRDGVLAAEFRAPNLYLLSNGTAVTPAVLKFCRDQRVQLSMSLPGLATLREHTGIGDPDQILENFRAAKALGLRTVASITVTKRNLPELYQTIAAAFLAGAQQLLLNRFLPGGRGLEHRDWVLDAREVRQMLDTAEEALTDAGRFGSVGTELPRCIVEPGKYKRLTVGTRCSAAQGFFVVGPAGYVRVCNHSPVDLVHVSDIELLKQNPYWKRFTQRDYLPKQCGGCAQAVDCDGGCREASHVVGGAVDSPDPLLVQCVGGLG